MIALACRNLPPEIRTRGIVLGTAGAIVLRVILIVFAVSLLTLPFLKLAGGALLLWIGVKLLVPEEGEGHGPIASGDTLLAAVRTVIVADLVMSIDNVIGIAAAAERADPTHQTGLVIFGLLVSIPIIVWGSRFVIRLIERFPIVVWFGGGLLGWIAGGMMITDSAVQGWVGALPGWSQYVAATLGLVGVVLVARWLAEHRPAESPHRS